MHFKNSSLRLKCEAVACNKDARLVSDLCRCRKLQFCTETRTSNDDISFKSHHGMTRWITAEIRPGNSYKNVDQYNKILFAVLFVSNKGYIC